ncbi:MAG: hypothetical protein FJ358_05050 [Thaumarchaeota archaeon]|nr:hypothetical protein [Nitrososphaerota archaeon]
MISKEFRTLLRTEVTRSISNRWLIVYALMYAALGLSLSYYGMLGLGYLGLRGFGRVSASLINLTLYLVPLISMSLSGLAVVSEREGKTLERLLSQPVSKTEILIAKYIGITISIGTATVLGYGLASWYMLFVLGPGDIGIFLSILFASILLTVALSAFGLAISTVSGSKFGALGAILMGWFVLVAVFDVLVMGATLVADLKWIDLIPILMINPVEAARILMIYSLDPTLIFLGPTGVYVARAFGLYIPIIFAGSLVLWTAGSMGLALVKFRNQDL